MNQTNESKNGKMVVMTLFLAMMSGNYFQYMLSPLAARVMETLNLTQTQFASVFSAPMLPAIFLGIVAGIFADRFGVRKVVTIALIIATCAVAFRPFAPGYLPFFLCMLVV